MWASRSPFDGHEQNPVGTGKRFVQTCVLFRFLLRKLTTRQTVTSTTKTKQNKTNWRQYLR